MIGGSTCFRQLTVSSVHHSHPRRARAQDGIRIECTLCARCTWRDVACLPYLR